MNKIITVLFCVAMVGCATQDQCADRPIFKPYTIDVPVRPVLAQNFDKMSDGEYVRTLEDDFATIIEYATKLENLLLALPKNISIPK